MRDSQITLLLSLLVTTVSKSKYFPSGFCSVKSDLADTYRCGRDVELLGAALFVRVINIICSDQTSASRPGGY